tara:strand:+ start:676 stop:885 length:210 start_codon:yes stop_codon:yes gene_type:complete
MKQFIIENTKKMQTIKIVVHNPPYEDENILEHCKWKAKDCVIKEVHAEYNEKLTNPSFMDNDDLDEGEE